MQLKISLHIHTKEDKKDGHMISYNVFQLIDEAEKCGFDVLGYTPHQKFVCRPEYVEYAKSKGILLIPGVERGLGRFHNKHVIILNCDKSAEKVKNFRQLAKYKQENPHVFVLAPHPTFSRLLSMGVRNLRKHINLFDAIEYSWLYSQKLNPNRRAEAIALEFNKPMISTSDVHVLKKLDMDFSLIEAQSFTAEGVFTAIKEKRIENVTEPKRIFDLAVYLLRTNFRYVFKLFEVKVLRLAKTQAGETEIDN